MKSEAVGAVRKGPTGCPSECPEAVQQFQKRVSSKCSCTYLGLAAWWCGRPPPGGSRLDMCRPHDPRG